MSTVYPSAGAFATKSGPMLALLCVKADGSGVQICSTANQDNPIMGKATAGCEGHDDVEGFRGVVLGLRQRGETKNSDKEMVEVCHRRADDLRLNVVRAIISILTIQP